MILGTDLGGLSLFLLGDFSSVLVVSKVLLQSTFLLERFLLVWTDILPPMETSGYMVIFLASDPAMAMALGLSIVSMESLLNLLSF